MREVRLLAQRFKKDILRYGYVLTEHGLMVQVERDIVDTELDVAHRAMLALDMEIISRLTYKPESYRRLLNDVEAGPEPKCARRDRSLS